jgi:flagellar protein FlbT
MGCLSEELGVAVKIELKPNERILLGDCVITNTDQRTHLMIVGASPILREKDIMSLSRAENLAKLVYLAVQFIHKTKRLQDHHALYVQLADEFLKRVQREAIC